MRSTIFHFFGRGFSIPKEPLRSLVGTSLIWFSPKWMRGSECWSPSSVIADVIDEWDDGSRQRSDEKRCLRPRCGLTLR